MSDDLKIELLGRIVSCPLWCFLYHVKLTHQWNKTLLCQDFCYCCHHYGTCIYQHHLDLCNFSLLLIHCVLVSTTFPELLYLVYFVGFWNLWAKMLSSYCQNAISVVDQIISRSCFRSSSFLFCKLNRILAAQSWRTVL